MNTSASETLDLLVAIGEGEYAKHRLAGKTISRSMRDAILKGATDAERRCADSLRATASEFTFLCGLAAKQRRDFSAQLASAKSAPRQGAA